jgi:dihydroflavonol-4-reductase
MSDEMRLVLVTGANGFVGSHLVEALLSRGYRVRCLVRRTSDLTFIHDLPVEWAYADLQDSEALARACQGVDAICHCAALTRALDEGTFLRINARGTEDLARAAVEVNPGLRRFFFVSSQIAVGPSQAADDFVDESRAPQPITWYGRSKWAAEQALCSMNDRLPLTIVRPCAVFGPRDRDFYAYFSLVKWRVELLPGRGERKLSLIYVKDLVALMILALENEHAIGQTYFACDQAHQHTELSASIAKALNKRPLRIILPEAALTPIGLWSKVQGQLTGKPALLNAQRILEMRQPYWLCSGDKARRELGFVPQYDLETAVQETADWYLANGWL